MTLRRLRRTGRHWTRLHRFGHLHAIAELGPGGDDAAQGQRGARRRRWPRWRRCCTACAPSRSSRRCSRGRGRAARRPWPAPTCARSGASGAAPTRCRQALVEAKSLATSRCEHAWRTQRRPTTGPASCQPARGGAPGARGGEVPGRRDGLAPYDALMDQFEPGMTSAEVDRVFGDLQAWLPGLVAAVRDAAGRRAVIGAAGPVRHGRAARAQPRRDGAARLRLRGRPPRRERASVQRRRARGHAPDHALPRGRLHAAA